MVLNIFFSLAPFHAYDHDWIFGMMVCYLGGFSLCCNFLCRVWMDGAVVLLLSTYLFGWLGVAFMLAVSLIHQ